MIGKLKGIIDKISDDHIIIDVGGVGYVVHASKSTIAAIGQAGATTTILIETHVREDQITLFGFATEQEKSWYNILVKVNGVGPKMALNILSAMSVENLQVAIAAKDKSAFKPVNGVGPKLAERIITELKDKNFDIMIADNVTSIKTLNNGNSSISSAGSDNNKKLADATSALENLGFNKSEAFSVVNRNLGKNSEAKVEDLIKQGLKELSGN